MSMIKVVSGKMRPRVTIQATRHHEVMPYVLSSKPRLLMICDVAGKGVAM